MKEKTSNNAGQKGYTDIDRLFSSIFYETRPFFIISILHPVVAGLLALGYVPDPLSRDAWLIIFGFLCYAFLEAGSNIWTNLNDIAEDAISKPTTLQLAGQLPPQTAMKASFTLYGLGTILALYYTYRLGNLTAFAGYLIYIVLSFIYSDKMFTKIRLKARWWAGPGAIGVGFAALSFALYTVFRELDLAGLGIVAITFLLYLYMGAVKDYRDIEGDRKAGNRTPASVDPWGTMVVSLLAAWLALAIQVLLAVIGVYHWLPVLLSAIAWKNVLKLTLEGKESIRDGLTMIKSFVDLKVLHPHFIYYRFNINKLS